MSSSPMIAGISWPEPPRSVPPARRSPPNPASPLPGACSAPTIGSMSASSASADAASMSPASSRAPAKDRKMPDRRRSATSTRSASTQQQRSTRRQATSTTARSSTAPISTPSSSPRRITGTPPIALEAMDRGKDVYLEKPMCHTVDEAKQLVDTVKETKRVLQVGSQTTSGDQWHQGQERIADGMLGQDADEPGLVPPQFDGRRVELADRRGGRSRRQGRQLHRLEDVARPGARSATGTPTASSASASIGTTRAASRPTSSTTSWRR